jgi:hypothetical protein
MEYEYKVTAFDAQVTLGDFKNGAAVKKVSAQLELALQTHARDGWELQGQYMFEVDVKAGCFDKLFGGQDTSFRIYQLVFRKPM